MEPRRKEIISKSLNKEIGFGLGILFRLGLGIIIWFKLDFKQSIIDK